ncbi:MAG: OmpA family protein [Nitrospiraceae bacterium]|nr:OmpA family protein [Nitrospiraceae bacterium]
MKRVNLTMATMAIGLMVISTGCAGHTRSTADTDRSFLGERIEDPFAHLPGDPGSRTATAVIPKPDSRQTDTASAMLASQAKTSGTTMYLFDIPFRFDRFTLLSDAQAMVEVNAMRLKENEESSEALLLEGRCDEVGTRDYNLVLGGRRAQAVRTYLVNLGLPFDSIAVVSYGKDRPLCENHNEVCWAKNRTVHFVVK